MSKKLGQAKPLPADDQTTGASCRGDYRSPASRGGARESEQRYRSLFENMLEGYAYCKMLFDDQDRPVDFVYLAVNSAFERLTGLKDVVGKCVTALIPGIKEAHPEVFEIYGRVANRQAGKVRN